MSLLVCLSLFLALLAALRLYAWREALGTTRVATARRTSEHWTERRARHARARAARSGAIYLGSAAVLLQGVAQLFNY